MSQKMVSKRYFAAVAFFSVASCLMFLTGYGASSLVFAGAALTSLIIAFRFRS